MPEKVELKSSDIMLLFAKLRELETQIGVLTKQQHKMAVSIENLTKPRNTLWKSRKNFFRRD